jgi:RNA polymerase sigma-70 factor (ECF subfamily)
VIQVSDMDLAIAAQAGDLDSFGELGRRYFNVLVAIAYTVLRDHHLAEDAAQESLAKALVNLMKLRETDRFAAWLRRICRNVAHDMAARKTDQALTEDVAQPVNQAQGSDGDGAVQQALTRLAPEARELIVLRYYNNCSYEQISAAMGLSRPAINGRLTRAKKKIADYLKRNALAEDVS